MTTATHSPLDRALMRLAQQQADGFGDAARPKRHVARRRLSGWLATVVVSAVASSAWWPSAPPPSAARGAVAQPSAQVPKPLPSARREAVATRGGIRRIDGEIRIEIEAMPLGHAVQELAAATGAVVGMPLGLTELERTISLRWRGRDASAAWQALLTLNASFASRCVGQRCEVWLASKASAPASANVPVDGAAAPVAPVQVIDEGLEIEAFGKPQ